MLASILNLVAHWIPGSLPKLVTERPDLLIDHALAYADLAKANLEAVRRRVLRRLVAGAIALASALSFVVLAGVAIMLWATGMVPQDSGWSLFAVPASALILALVAGFVAMSKGAGTSATPSVVDQVRMDIQAFRAVAEVRS